MGDIVMTVAISARPHPTFLLLQDLINQDVDCVSIDFFFILHMRIFFGSCIRIPFDSNI